MIREGKQRKPIHLSAHFPGVNNTTVWSDPDSGSQVDFDSFVHLARKAEEGLFDFFSTSAWPAPSTPRSTNRSKRPANSPASTCSPRAAPPGTW
jgi:hypothetical protein